MKVVYIGVFQTLNASKLGYRCAATYNLQGVVTPLLRRPAFTVMNGHIAKICKHEKVQEKPDAFVAVMGTNEVPNGGPDMSNYLLYFRIRPEGIAVCVITDKEYPARTAQSLAFRVADEFCVRYPRSAYENMAEPQKDNDAFSLPQIDEYIVKYQDPSNADIITKIEKEMDEIKQSLHGSINELLGRGEKIDTLLVKSEGLSATSKLFYTQAKKQNSCCVVM